MSAPTVQPESSDYPLLPDWVPVLRRGADDLQIGIDPDCGVVLTGVPPALDPILALLDGSHSVATLRTLAEGAGVPGRLLDWVLRSLEGARLLRSAATRATDPADHRIRLIGAGRLGRAVTHAAVDAGVGGIYLVDPDPVDPADYPRAGLATTQADALRTEIRVEADRMRTRPRTEITVVDHWTQPDRVRPDLTVIATDRAEPDRAIGEDYVRSDHPHLYLRPLHGGVVVGPLVRPGRTPCLACLDQRRRDADPAWPLLLGQLCRIQTPVSPLIAGWAASTAVTQILAALDGTAATTAAGTLEMTPADCTVKFRQWPMHPRCGCAWHG